MSNFSERLKELMTERELNAPELAKQLNTDRTNITRYLKGERTPSYETFIKMLNYFNCSADFLCGLDDYAETHDFSPLENFGERLRKVMAEYGKTQYAMEKQLGVSGSVVYNWLNGVRQPNVDSLIRLANYIGCSLDYLLGRIK